MTDMNSNFRLGMFSQRILFDFNGWLQDQMGKAALGPGNQRRFAKDLWGEVGKCFITLK